jgi:pimeloyl-ACP methyl ester carboxylesterase
MVPAAFTHHQVPIGAHSLHLVEAGHDQSESVVFLHGWPEDWTEWQRVMERASQTHHVLALDLPGVGASRGAVPGGEKAALAETIHQAIQALSLAPYLIVGHDVGAMVAYAYLRKFAAELKAAVLISSVVPGLEPWSKVLTNPSIWHFAFHSIPSLPEALIVGKQRVYFDYFFDTLTHNHAAIDEAAREHHVTAYASPQALQAGFDWYRAFSKDAEANRQDTAHRETPLLYLRGEYERGEIEEYANGFRTVGISSVMSAPIPGSGHFTPEENPEAVWSKIAGFL